jgi:hypothetical protein
MMNPAAQAVATTPAFILPGIVFNPVPGFFMQ